MTRPSSKNSTRTATLLGAAFVFIVGLVTYCLTLAPTVTLVDSGELIVAARFLGVAYPPGFPSYAYVETVDSYGDVTISEYNWGTPHDNHTDNQPRE